MSYQTYLSVANELGQCHQGCSPGWFKLVQLRDSFLDQIICDLSALLNAQQLGVGGLVDRHVLGSGLTQLLSGLGHIEDVVNDLCIHTR